ncbi:hypothetical protein [Mycolicibacterium vaccae]|uniref:Uncharacterized protein n=1 Tax=Mycolicibacterium vaccae ATCC 25954 TaxID=1194972 RepID=K0UHP8_MYCVA|nr:hypothetical protein [Mycolicibacterium vaccae]ANI39537.1 hypothetical protein MYVA_2358 [Mycolicibacterium vaccae 95051]EJZ04445.1 hypothetical protein MVAC_28848 [Mycolicibacterium vaccae ATCC 25954]
MSRPDAADLRAHPAPGSAVPGAPPALKRALTPADGVVEAGSAPSAVTEYADPRRDAGAADSSDGSGLRGAFVLLGVAAGLEMAAVISRRHRRKY